ncbi:DUF5324 family protein [Allostreptomyces psammosilenae]|uniref:Putative transcriptional regulator n=1 Tax=Allostreptomyces psammosilenae TaxID=1892865 RepID=A0A852ZUW7_9ACTN|nr:DUF5324 family protein [Allostreptomyces psammosilenae]NYI05387.1 putative transcriptional regulator [Allostreptomyces psammosilenae]
MPDAVAARLDTVRDAARRTRHQLAPRAVAAREAAITYADEARSRVAPRVELARAAARARYRSDVRPYLRTARRNVPVVLEQAAKGAAHRARAGVDRAAEYAAPRVGAAVAGARQVAEPYREEAASRGGAALAALRGQVSAEDVERLLRRRHRRERRARSARALLLFAATAAAAAVAWRTWQRRNEPDWLGDDTATEVFEASGGTGARPLGSDPSGSGADGERIEGGVTNELRATAARTASSAKEAVGHAADAARSKATETAERVRPRQGRAEGTEGRAPRQGESGAPKDSAKNSGDSAKDSTQPGPGGL